MATDISNLVTSALVGELEELGDSVKKIAETLSENDLWKKPVEPGNSIGHLILHLIGNLNHFVGAHLGKTGYVRDREREFTETALPKKEVVIAELDKAVALFRRVVAGLTSEQLAAPFPDARFGLTLNALLHWVTHFALHRGQISYITRMLKAS